MTMSWWQRWEGRAQGIDDTFNDQAKTGPEHSLRPHIPHPFSRPCRSQAASERGPAVRYDRREPAATLLAISFPAALAAASEAATHIEAVNALNQGRRSLLQRTLALRSSSAVAFSANASACCFQND